MWLHYHSFYFKLISRQIAWFCFISQKVKSYSFYKMPKCQFWVIHILTQLKWHIYNITPLSQTRSHLALQMLFLCVFQCVSCFSHSYYTLDEQNHVPRGFEQCRLGVSEWPLRKVRCFVQVLSIKASFLGLCLKIQGIGSRDGCQRSCYLFLYNSIGSLYAGS